MLFLLGDVVGFFCNGEYERIMRSFLFCLMFVVIVFVVVVFFVIG